MDSLWLYYYYIIDVNVSQSLRACRAHARTCGSELRSPDPTMKSSHSVAQGASQKSECIVHDNELKVLRRRFYVRRTRSCHRSPSASPPPDTRLA
eukprot:scaffold4502_cov119-Isochrysis_galbana.AAC.4